jgi:hypothetical protein
MSVEEINTGRDEPSSGQSSRRATDGGAGGILKHTVDEAIERARQTKEEIVEEARGSARSLLDEQRKRVAEELEIVASAVREAGRKLKEEDREAAAHYTDRAAEGVERVSNYLHERHFGEVLEDAGELLRRQPALFIAGAFTAGFFLARFLKSSAEGVEMSAGYSLEEERISREGSAGSEALH